MGYLPPCYPQPLVRRKRIFRPECASGLRQHPRRPTRARGSPRAHDHRSEIVKISARNRIKGKVLEVKKGATTAHVRLEIAPGQIITASITNEAVDELGLKAGG